MADQPHAGKFSGWIAFHPGSHVGIPVFQSSANVPLTAETDDLLSITKFHRFYNEDGYQIILNLRGALITTEFRVGGAVPLPFRAGGKNYVVSADTHLPLFVRQFREELNDPAVERVIQLLQRRKPNSAIDLASLDLHPTDDLANPANQPGRQALFPSNRPPSVGFVLDGRFRSHRRTLKTAIGCVGVGLHSGRRIALTVRPAVAGHGIRFVRTDLGIEIPALYDRVADTRLCTALVAPEAPEARVGSVEHVMAALASCGVDDVIVQVDGPEVPILDGSAAPFVFLLDCAGTVPQASGAYEAIEVLRAVRVAEGAAFAELRPNKEAGLDASLTIDFPATAIGRQHIALRITPASFRAQLAEARTFVFAEEIARLRAAGLAQGGSLANAVVVDGPLVLNPGGLRWPDEFVRHKLLDALGDLALAGAPLRGRFIGHRSGHSLIFRLLKALFSDKRNWRRVRVEHSEYTDDPSFIAIERGVAEVVVA